MAKRSRSLEFAKKINELRAFLGDKDPLTQEALGKRVGVTRSQISSWEAGREYPSAEKLIALGHQASGHPLRLWFWEKAGLKVAEIEEEIRAKMIAGRSETALSETVSIKRMDSTTLLREVRNLGPTAEADLSNSVRFPSLFVPEPALTRCIQLTDLFAGSGFSAGDVALIQLARGSLLNLLNRSVAVFYERLSPERLLTPEAVRRLPRARYFAEVDRRENELNRSRDPLIRAETDQKNEELAAKFQRDATGPGVLFGVFSIEYDEIAGGSWRAVLNCGTFWRALTLWNAEEPPSEATLAISPESGIHVLGPVIGWLRGPAGG
jgi:transcriptional regulator with XRE-family HTH domain